MLVGYNTNIPYKGKVYHVQTEDSGIKNPVIITHLYFHGSILASKKISYAHFAEARRLILNTQFCFTNNATIRKK